MDLKESDLLGEGLAEHWYYRSKAAAARLFLGAIGPAVVLDGGAGSGFFAKFLLGNSPAAEAWCIDIAYAEEGDSLHCGKPIHFRRSAVAASGSASHPDSADVVLLMDVLEYVDDDLALLADYVGRSPRGARFLITVPAFQWLWSAHDDFLGHRRRYTLPELEDLATRAGLHVDKGAYYFALVLPLAAATRVFERLFSSAQRAPRSQLQRHGRLINGLLAWLCALELPLFPANRRLGLSAFCLASKP